MEIRTIDNEQTADAVALIWTTFLQFEAPDYSEKEYNRLEILLKIKPF